MRRTRGGRRIPADEALLIPSALPLRAEPMVDLVGPLLLSVLLGSLYTLMALGLTMTYAVTRVPNFAHAEYVTVGGYAAAVVALAFGAMLAASGLPAVAVIVLASVLAFAAAAAVALGSDELVFKPLTRRGATPLHLLVASIGVGLVIRYLLSIVVASGDLLVVRSPIDKEILVTIGGAPFTNLHAWVIPTTFGVVIGLHLLFTRTRPGKAMRAMASNYDLARVAGIRTVRVRRWTWLIAGGLAGLGGAFWVINVPVQPETGWVILLFLFAASILGGFTSFWGTVAGGFIVGFAEIMGMSLLNQLFGVPLSYRPMIALAIIVIVFLFRPQGITGLTMPDFRALARRFVARFWPSRGGT